MRDRFPKELGKSRSGGTESLLGSRPAKKDHLVLSTCKVDAKSGRRECTMESNNPSRPPSRSLAFDTCLDEVFEDA